MGAVWILDACVLIDIRAGRLLKEISELSRQLGDALITTDLVVGELNEDPDEADLRGLGVEIIEFSGETLDTLAQLRAGFSGLSMPDASVLFAAVERNGTLLTNEGLQRNHATGKGLDVHGTLWALSEMVRLDVVTRERAARALEDMLAHGSRFPEGECTRLLGEWDGSE